MPQNMHFWTAKRLCLISMIMVIVMFIWGVLRMTFMTSVDSNESEIPPMFIKEKIQQTEQSPQSHVQNLNKGITLLFVAGMEGTGHHLWLNITTTMSRSFPNDVDVTFYHSVSPYNFSPDLRDCFAIDNTIDGHHCRQVAAKLKQIYLHKYKDKQILMHLRSFSYPFMALDLKHVPSIIKLKTIINNINKDLNPDKNVFTLKFIVLKREWVSALVSCCINRYGRCHQRVDMLPKTLHILNQQLMHSAASDWFMLDYDDFVSRALQYKYIIAEWLNIRNIDIVETGLTLVDNKKGSKNATQKSWQIVSEKMSKRSANGNIKPQNLNGLKEKISENFYSENAKANAALFHNQCVVVTPENKQFLNQSFKCDII